MAWYVEYLLRNRERIKCKQDIESDEFNDLLFVEKEITKFINNKLFTIEELDILNFIMGNTNVLPTNIRVILIHNTMHKISNRLAMCLGGIFTNEGYIEYIRTKYKLTGDQTDFLARYIYSNYKTDKIIKTHKEIK